MTSVNWLDEREQRAWRALQFMQMRLTARLARRPGCRFRPVVPRLPGPRCAHRPARRAPARLRTGEGARLGAEPLFTTARMTDRWLITRDKCDSDRRGAYVAVTTAGREAITRAAPGHVATVRRGFLDQLTAHELDVIGTAASKVLAALDDDD